MKMKMAIERRQQPEESPQVAVKRFHIDGAGARPDGTGSGFAWVRLGTERQRVHREDGLTNNAAEYRALLSVLRYLAAGRRARIFTDSQLVCEQYNGRWAINDPKLVTLLTQARDLIEDKELEIEVRWIPREENVAGKLLDRG
jgi:ribonuclease HI